MRLLRASVIALFLCFLAAAQEPLTNSSIIKMVQAKLSEDVILSMVKLQPAKYVTGADEMISLKAGGVSDKVIAAMIEKMHAPAAATPTAAAPTAAAPAVVSEVGVYYKKGDAWVDVPPEVVNFKTGGILKSIGTAGLVKGDINGNIAGDNSKTALKSPVDLLIYTPEGVAITEYQFLRLRDAKNAREFRTVTGGILHVSGGATRDLVPFESKKLAPRTYEIVLPSIGIGEYGFLPPASADPTASTGRIGKIYSFRVIE